MKGLITLSGRGRRRFGSRSRLVNVVYHLVDGRLSEVRPLVRLRQPVTMTTSTRYHSRRVTTATQQFLQPSPAEHEMHELVSVEAQRDRATPYDR